MEQDVMTIELARLQAEISTGWKRYENKYSEVTPVKNTPELDAYWERVRTYDPVKHIDIADFKRQIKGVLDTSVKKLDFHINEINRPILKNFTDWVYGIPCDYDPSKGILLIGSYGTGKTSIMKAFSMLTTWYGLRPFKMAYCKQIIDTIENTKDAAWIHEYHSGSWCLDELGAETSPGAQSNLWGNKKSIFGDLIEYRERKKHITHATTNKDMNELKTIYGDRVFSRLHTMFNIVYLDGKDWRMT